MNNHREKKIFYNWDECKIDNDECEAEDITLDELRENDSLIFVRVFVKDDEEIRQECPIDFGEVRHSPQCHYAYGKCFSYDRH